MAINGNRLLQLKERQAELNAAVDVASAEALAATQRQRQTDEEARAAAQAFAKAVRASAQRIQDQFASLHLTVGVSPLHEEKGSPRKLDVTFRSRPGDLWYTIALLANGKATVVWGKVPGAKKGTLDPFDIPISAEDVADKLYDLLEHYQSQVELPALTPGISFRA